MSAKIIYNLGMLPGAFQKQIMIQFIKYILYKNYSKANRSNCMLFTFEGSLKFAFSNMEHWLNYNIQPKVEFNWAFVNHLFMHMHWNLMLIMVRYRISRKVYAVTFITNIFDLFLLLIPDYHNYFSIKEKKNT